MLSVIPKRSNFACKYEWKCVACVLRMTAKSWLMTVCLQEPDDLFETISQAMLNAVDRDAVSGMGVVVHVM